MADVTDRVTFLEIEWLSCSNQVGFLAGFLVVERTGNVSLQMLLRSYLLPRDPSSSIQF